MQLVVALLEFAGVAFVIGGLVAAFGWAGVAIVAGALLLSIAVGVERRTGVE